MSNTNIGHFVTVLLHAPDGNLLLLERSMDKKLFPGLWTGVGGALEFVDGQLESVEQGALREIREETGLEAEEITDLRLRLVTPRVEDGYVTIISWLTGLVYAKRTPNCPEGTLHWIDRSELSNRPFIPSAAVVIPWLVQLPDEDMKVYEGTYQRHKGMITGLSIIP